MKINVYNLEPTVVGEMNLPAATFAAKGSDQVVAQAIRVYLQDQRRSTAKTKNRNEVSGTTKKVWSQKGTGNARHGSRKAPIFVGGGVTHGPTGEQNFKLSLTKKMSKKAKRLVLSKLAANKAVAAIEKLSAIDPKTKAAAKLLAGLKAKDAVLSKSRKIGVLLAKNNGTVTRAFGNLPEVKLLTLQSLNVYDLSLINYLIASKKALTEIAK
ncbi:50S ribosomal protein L4 [Patescibacteria group bacterium]|nr:50S ribosomal protein L4 [Patescibacteria group bacterium]